MNLNTWTELSEISQWSCKGNPCKCNGWYSFISSICLYLYNLTVVLSFLDVTYCTSATFDVAMFCAMYVGDAQCKTREPSSATNNSHAWPQTGPSVVKLWSPEQQSKEMMMMMIKQACISSQGRFSLELNLKKKIANPWPLIFIDLCMA